MAKHIKKDKYTQFLTCPFCATRDRSTLLYTRSGFKCKSCNNVYPLRKGIIEFVKQEVLDKHTKNELSGNKIKLDKKTITHYANKDKWSKYYNHFVDIKINKVLKAIKAADRNVIVSLGSGPGFELKEIMKRKKFDTLLSSDLAFSATAIVPTTLKKYNCGYILFTSDLNYPPVLKRNDQVILIYEALHHTKDAHKTVGKLMSKKYDHIVFVEPITNIFVKLLSLIGIAQREEYSGLIPNFIILSKIKELAIKYKYNINVNTMWEIPEDYFRLVIKKKSRLEQPMIKLIDIISYLGNLIKFGNFAVVHLEKIDILKTDES